MIQLRIVTEGQTQSEREIRSFPFVIGREEGATLRLDQPGIWPGHANIDLDQQEGFRLSVRPEALAMLNGQPVQIARLANGDEVAVGSVRIQFWLSRTRQRRFQLTETFSWLSFAALFGLQIVLIHRVLP